MCGENIKIYSLSNFKKIYLFIEELHQVFVVVCGIFLVVVCELLVTACGV